MSEMHDDPRTCWDGWSIVPGPVDFIEPFLTTDLGDDIASYDPAQIAEAVLQLGNVELIDPAEPNWWDWSAQLRATRGSQITLKMTLFDVEPTCFGGFDLDGEARASEMLALWNALKGAFSQLWLHAPTCRLYKPDSFAREYGLKG